MNGPAGTPGNPEAGHLSRLAISRLLAGDLSPGEQAPLEAHLQSCAKCSATFKAAGETARGFAERYPTPEYLRATRRGFRNAAREEVSGPWGRLRAVLAGAGRVRSALAGLILLAAAGSLIWLSPIRRPGEVLSPKGNAEASFYLFVNGQQVSGGNVSAKPSDTLQLGIRSPEPIHFAVLYRDDQAPLSHYLAPDQVKPAGGPSGENIPNSLILDANWKRSVLYCVWSQRPFTLEDAKSASDRAGGQTNGDSLHVQTFLLENVAR